MADETTKKGGAIFAALFLAFSLLMLSQLGEQTKFSSKTWWTGKMVAQPAFWPGVGVVGMTVFGTLHLVISRGWNWREGALWLRPLEYLAWFMAYVWATPVVGYLPATVVFAVLLALRAGYRERRMLGAAALTGVAVVLVFKTTLQVNIPGGAAYEYLPDALRNLMIARF